MKNTTLAMVAILAAVAMLSAGLALPTQQAIASDGGGQGNIEVEQKNECSEGDFTGTACSNFADIDSTIDNSERGPD